ncbi:unnamed protein product [Citrullus colocynthis]|uniref:Secreted protein n=1 Tax=Citrullus colocynthis TaxID=252529 RepID=A0ABP0XPN5_9ROSI
MLCCALFCFMSCIIYSHLFPFFSLAFFDTTPQSFYCEDVELTHSFRAVYLPFRGCIYSYLYVPVTNSLDVVLREGGGAEDRTGPPSVAVVAPIPGVGDAATEVGGLGDGGPRVSKRVTTVFPILRINERYTRGGLGSRPLVGGGGEIRVK